MQSVLICIFPKCHSEQSGVQCVTHQALGVDLSLEMVE